MNYETYKESPAGTWTKASNASDFQPPTQNPQAEAQDLQTANPLQNTGATSTQDQLQDLGNVPLKVEAYGTGTIAPSSTPRSSMNPVMGWLWAGLGLVVALVTLYLLLRDWRSKPAPIAQQTQPSTQKKPAAKKKRTTKAKKRK